MKETFQINLFLLSNSHRDRSKHREGIHEKTRDKIPARRQLLINLSRKIVIAKIIASVQSHSLKLLYFV